MGKKKGQTVLPSKLQKLTDMKISSKARCDSYVHPRLREEHNCMCIYGENERKGAYFVCQHCCNTPKENNNNNNFSFYWFKGDSGSGVILDGNIVIGIVRGGLVPCGRYPSHITSVFDHLFWVYRVMRNCNATRCIAREIV